MNLQPFLDIEKKYDLYHIEINGTNIWQYSRFKLWYQICADELSMAPAFASLKKKEKLKAYLKTFRYILTHKNSRKICKADIFLCGSGAKIKRGESYQDKYLGELENAFRDSFIMEPCSMNHAWPTQSQKEYYTEPIYLKSWFLVRLRLLLNKKEYNRIYQEIEKAFTVPLKEIMETYHVKVDTKSLFGKMAISAIKIRQNKKEYKRLFSRVKPKVIIQICHYSRVMMIINEVAKEMGISTIELQHGAMAADHIPYQYAEECGVIRQFPDYIFTFSEYWKAEIHPPIKKDCVKAVGFPYLEQVCRLYPKKKKDERQTILFISQGPIAKQLSRLAVEIRERMEKKNFRIIYKLHPGEIAHWKERMPWLDRNDIEVIDDKRYEVYQCFAESDVQIGVYSTAIYEGMVYELDTYIYQVGPWDRMETLVEHGYASFISDADDFVTKWNAKTVSESFGRSRFWKENALSNMLGEIKKISGIHI